MSNDSLRILSDSLSYPGDTIFCHPDTIDALAVPVFQGFPGEPFAALPQSQGWVFVLFLSIFVLLAVGIRLFPSLFSEGIDSVFRVKERSSLFNNTSAGDSRFRIVFVFLSVCVISLYAYFILYTPDTGPFSFMIYLRFLCATVLFFLFKYIFVRLLGYVFFEGKTITLAANSFFYLIILCGMALFPLLVIHIYASSYIGNVVQYISLGICICVGILVILKLFQIFFSKILDCFYILLYLCTLEILPILVLFQVYQRIL